MQLDKAKEEHAALTRKLAEAEEGQVTDRQPIGQRRDQGDNRQEAGGRSHTMPV